VVGWEADSSEI